MRPWGGKGRAEVAEKADFKGSQCMGPMGREGGREPYGAPWSGKGGGGGAGRAEGVERAERADGAGRAGMLGPFKVS